MQLTMFPLNFCLIFVINKVLCSNILAITTLTSPSHHLFNDVLLLELANRGHNVTLLGHDADKHKHPNYTHIVMEGVYGKIFADMDIIGLKNDGSWASIKSMRTYSKLICDLDIETEGLKTFLQYPKSFKFDLVIWDINAGHCLIPIIDNFDGNPPIVGVNPFVSQPNLFKNIYQSYSPFYLKTYSDKMNLWERLENNFWLILHELYEIFVFFPEQEKIAEDYFGKTGVDIRKYLRRVSLVLTNYNPVLNYVQALPPNIIPVGGMHINRHQSLSGKLQTILDNAKTGLVLFSLGTNIKSKDLGKEKISAIINAFSKLSQTVIWKFEYDLSDLPKNLHIMKWVPQSAILSHPNTVLFISHGGLLSSHEAVYFGVPVIGVPFYLDQISNIAQLVNKGMGEKIDFDDLGTDYFLETMIKILNNNSYFNTAKTLSHLYRDQPIKPLESAVFWTEYVLKHGGAHHFDLAVRDMNFAQMLNLDIFLVFLAILSSIGFILKHFVSIMYKTILRSQNTVDKRKIGLKNRKLD